MEKNNKDMTIHWQLPLNLKKDAEEAIIMVMI